MDIGSHDCARLCFGHARRIHSTNFANSRWKGVARIHGLVLYLKERDMEIWMMSHTVFYMVYQHGIREAGIHVLESLIVAMNDARTYRHCGQPNCIMVKSAMLTGEDVEVKNAIHVPANAREDVGFSIAVICRQFLKTMYVLQTHRTFMLSTNRNIMLHKYEPYILLEQKRL